MENTQAQKIRYPFKYNEALYVYFCTDHTTCKSVFDYHYYFEDAFKCILYGIPKMIIPQNDTKVLRNQEITNPICDFRSITKATKISKLKDFVAIDLETTGLQTGGNDIIEICAIKFQNFIPSKMFYTFLKPRNPIPAEATAINRITDSIVQAAPPFSRIRDALQEFIGDYPLVAHNAGFDMKFLHVCGLDLEGHADKVFDTLSLSRAKVRDYDGDKLENYKLATVCDQLNIACKNFHSANADALACGIAFVDIIKIIHDVDNIKDLLGDK